MTESQSVKQRKPHQKILLVNSSGLISDPDVRGPRLREEVIAPPPEFEFRDPTTRKFIKYYTDQAIRWISQYPSLQIKFTEIGYRRIDFIQSALLFDQALTSSARNQFKLELIQLERDDFPIWKNTILSTRQYVGRLINSAIHEWMHEPVDFSEQSFFKAGWEDFPFSYQAATNYLHQLSSHTRDALKITLEDYQHIDTKEKFKFFRLNQTIQMANKKVRLLDLDFSFE